MGRRRTRGECDHRGAPILMQELPDGRLIARCLKCGTLGPPRATSAEAKRALEGAG